MGGPAPKGTAFDHPALFYRGDEHYLSATVPFVLEGHAAGEPVAVAAPLRKLDLLRGELGRAADLVTFLDMTAVGRNPGRIIAEVLLATADRFPGQRVRIIGEPIWPGRSELEYPACVQHEALINLAFRDRSAVILCPYDADDLDDAVLDDAARTHPVIVERTARASAAYDAAGAFTSYNVEFPEPVGAEVVHFDSARLSVARALVASFAQRTSLDADRVDDIVLAVGELAANSIRHGGGRGTLRLWTEGGLLAVEVSDAGTITDPLAGRRPVPITARGGRGLLFVHHLADLVRIHTGPGGTAVRIYARLR